MPDNPPVEALVRVYNKRGHTITVGKSVIPPQSFGTVPASVASSLMKQWPTGVVAAEEAHKEVGGATAEANEAKAALAVAQKRIADLEAKLGKPSNKRILELEAQVAKLEEQLTSPAESVV